MLLHDFCAHKQLKFINFRAFFNHLKNGLGTLLCLLYLTCGGLYSPVASAEERSVVDQTASMQGLLLELKAQIADLQSRSHSTLTVSTPKEHHCVSAFDFFDACQWYVGNESNSWGKTLKSWGWVTISSLPTYANKQDDSLLSRIATKDISGTSGSRGSEGKSFSVLSFKNQRAIGKDMLKYTTGLPRLMGLDFSQVGKEPILELLKTTWGADLILSELIDFLQTSPMRSASLQISDQAIKSGINYHRNSIIKLAQALGKPFSLNTNSTKKQRLKIAMYILQQWRMLLSEDRNQTSILLSNRLDAYNAIMNQINELNAMTDHMIENIVARGVTEADINLLQSLSALIWVNVDLGLPNIPNF